jgi:hypothetical protein
MKTQFFLLLMIFIPILTNSQTLIEDFENGLDDWEFWYLGSNEPPIVWLSDFDGENVDLGLSYMEYYDGSASLYLAPYGFGYITALKDINCHYGTYWLYFKVLPNEPLMSSVAFFCFMAEDAYNHYSIHMYPQHSDWPQLSISKKINNEITFLVQDFDVHFYHNVWYKLVVVIDENGVISAQIINLEGQIIKEVAAIDTEIEVKGKIGVKCFSNTSYFDNINYSSFTDKEIINNQNNKISLFPNPAKDIIYLSNCFSDSYYSITDVNGRIIKTGNLLENSVNIQSLDNGIYFITVSETNKKTLRFVKGL